MGGVRRGWGEEDRVPKHRATSACHKGQMDTFQQRTQHGLPAMEANKRRCPWDVCPLSPLELPGTQSYVSRVSRAPGRVWPSPDNPARAAPADSRGPSAAVLALYSSPKPALLSRQEVASLLSGQDSLSIKNVGEAWDPGGRGPAHHD